MDGIERMKDKNEPIRVLNLFTIMNRGGAETMVMNYYRKLDKSRVQFDFMVHRPERGAYDDEIESLGGKIYRMPAIRPWTAMQYRKVVRKFYEDHPEYKIIHSHMSELGYYDFLEAEKAGIPVRICHAHSRPYGIDIKSPVRWYYKTLMIPHISHMFMCGEEAGEWLFGKKNKSRFIQLNNAIDTENYRFNEKKRNKLRRDLDLTNQLVIGHVGGFCTPKNHLFIIDIFEQVYKKNKTAVLVLVGDGEDRDKIEEKVRQHDLAEAVRFLGVRSDIQDLLQVMDVFLFPSLFEGLSVASIEAQAAGLPVLISDKVPIECQKTDLVQVVSLNESPSVWAERTLEAAKTIRRDTSEEIKEAGFDIKENAKFLQDFYIRAASGEK